MINETYWIAYNQHSWAVICCCGRYYMFSAVDDVVVVHLLSLSLSRLGRVTMYALIFLCISCTSNDTSAPSCPIDETKLLLLFTVDIHQSACSIKMIKCYEFPKKPFARLSNLWNCKTDRAVYDLFHSFPVYCFMRLACIFGRIRPIANKQSILNIKCQQFVYSVFFSRCNVDIGSFDFGFLSNRYKRRKKNTARQRN